MELWMSFGNGKQYSFGCGIGILSEENSRGLISKLGDEIPSDLLGTFSESLWENVYQFEEIADEAFEFSRDRIADAIADAEVDEYDIDENDIVDIVYDAFYNILYEFKLSYQLDGQDLNISVDGAVEKTLLEMLLNASDVGDYIRATIKECYAL